MPGVGGFLLVRVDDRLLHGQVVLGWRHRLGFTSFWIADDAVASDALEQEILRSALPDGAALVVRSLQEFLRGEADPGPGPAVLLIRGLAELRRLVAGGFAPTEVNLGGLHHRPGARRVLDYLFLTEDDAQAIRDLRDRGIRLYAQDLPGSRRVEAEDLLGRETSA